MIYPRRKDGKPSTRYPRCEISDMADADELKWITYKVEQDERRRGK